MSVFSDQIRENWDRKHVQPCFLNFAAQENLPGSLEKSLDAWIAPHTKKAECLEWEPSHYMFLRFLRWFQFAAKCAKLLAHALKFWKETERQVVGGLVKKNDRNHLLIWKCGLLMTPTNPNTGLYLFSWPLTSTEAPWLFILLLWCHGFSLTISVY